MYGWHRECPVDGSKGAYEGDDLEVNLELLEMRGKCYSEASRLLIEAITEMQSKSTDLEITSLKMRKAVEYIKYDLYYYTFGLSKAVNPDKTFKNRTDWWNNETGIGNVIDKKDTFSFNMIADSTNIALHPEIETDQTRSSLDLAMSASLSMYVEWVNEILSGIIPELILEAHERGKSAWAPISDDLHEQADDWPDDLDDEDEDYYSDEDEDYYGSMMSVSVTAEDEDYYGDEDEDYYGDEIEEPEEDSETDLLELAKMAIIVSGGEDDWIPLSGISDRMGTISDDSKFGPQKYGFPTMWNMMLSFSKEIMVARGEAALPLVKIRGSNDPQPPWAYMDGDVGLLIRDAINQFAGVGGWAYMRDLKRAIERLCPDFKVSHHGHRTLGNLVRNLGLYRFEIDLTGLDSRIRNSPVRYLAQAILQDPKTKKLGDWSNCEELQRITEVSYPIAAPERFGFKDVREMALAYEVYFEYSEEADSVSMRQWRSDLTDAIRNNISNLADQDGWAAMSTLGSQLTFSGFGTSIYGYANLTNLIEDMLRDEVEFNKKGGDSGGHKVRIKVPVDYEGMTVKQLIGIARERGLSGYSKLRKAELIELIRADESD